MTDEESTALLSWLLKRYSDTTAELYLGMVRRLLSQGDRLVPVSRVPGNKQSSYVLLFLLSSRRPSLYLYSPLCPPFFAALGVEAPVPNGGVFTTAKGQWPLQYPLPLVAKRRKSAKGEQNHWRAWVFWSPERLPNESRDMDGPPHYER